MTVRTLLITGASSGIGRALAEHYAAAGIRLLLLGRNEARLAQAAEHCRAKGAEVLWQSIDVCDYDAMREWICARDGERPIDLAFANAGISGGTRGGGESAEQALAIFETNVSGVLHTVLPMAECMKARGRGQIGIMSSLAALRGLPGAPAYSASKAAVKAYGDALRGALKPHGVSVTVICPGFIHTPLTDKNEFPWMPFLMEPDKAARLIAAGLSRAAPCVLFPWQLALPLKLAACLPVRVSDRIFAALPEK